jgi:hypothetical protein
VRLTIFTHPDPGARSVYERAFALKPIRSLNVGMDDFAVVNNTVNDTALLTTGANPCMIIVVHNSRGIGALGHLAQTVKAVGLSNDNYILGKVELMVHELPGQAADTILFAGGEGWEDKQYAFEQRIVAAVAAKYGGTSVSWPHHELNKGYGCCYYLPLREEVAFTTLTWSFKGLGDEGEGFSKHSYGKI